MARKKQASKSKLSPTLMTVGILALLALGILGVQVPDFLQEYFGVSISDTATSVPINSSNPSAKNPGPLDNGLATFSKEDLKDSAQGWIRYNEMDQLDRATGAEALLKKKMIGTGTGANREIRPAGFISGLDPYNHSRGHLIGKQFGGSGDDERNLVTLYQNPVNTPYMTTYENQIRQALDKGETVRYRVTPIYDANTLMCKEIHLEAQSIEPSGTVNFNVTIINEK